MVSINNRQYELFLDVSGSMTYDAVGMGSDPANTMSRWEQAQEIIGTVAQKVSKLDPDGANLTTFGSKLTHYPKINGSKIQAIFEKEPEDPKTDLLTAMQYAASKFAEMVTQSPDNKMTILVFTDGQPVKGTEGQIRDLIIKMANVCQDKSQLAISFLQLGDQKDATVFLNYLDDMQKDTNLVMKFDVVDTKRPSDFDAGMTVDQYLELAITD
jgi:von Willebrand factor type A domain